MDNVRIFLLIATLNFFLISLTSLQSQTPASIPIVPSIPGNFVICADIDCSQVHPDVLRQYIKVNRILHGELSGRLNIVGQPGVCPEHNILPSSKLSSPLANGTQIINYSVELYNNSLPGVSSVYIAYGYLQLFKVIEGQARLIVKISVTSKNSREDQSIRICGMALARNLLIYLEVSHDGSQEDIDKILKQFEEDAKRIEEEKIPIYADCMHQNDQPIPSSTMANVNFDHTIRGVCVYQPATDWKFIAPRAGKYLVTVFLKFRDEKWNAGHLSYIHVYTVRVDGDKEYRSSTMIDHTVVQRTATQGVSLSGSRVVHLEKGQYLQLKVLHLADGNRTLQKSATSCTVTRIAD